MNFIKRLYLSECAICPYAIKKEGKKLKCGWDAPKKYVNCDTITECGNFSEWIKQLDNT